MYDSRRPLLLRGGRIIDPAVDLDLIGDVLVVDGAIAEVGPARGTAPADAQSIDVTGAVVCPGFVDLHTHLRFPGFPAKETISTGTAAAAAGGFTTVCAMANTRPVVDCVDVFLDVADAVAREAVVHVRQLGAVSVGLAGQSLSDFEGLAAAGAVAFSDDGKPVWNRALMSQALRRAEALGLPISVHEEDPEVVRGGVANAGEPARRHRLGEWPCTAEAGFVRRDLGLLADTGAHLHVAHVSCADTVPFLREARANGWSVSAEVTPHHLRLTDRLLDGDAVLGFGAAHACTKVNPPLRSPEDVAAMVEALADGTIGAVATDHAPHTSSDKSVPYAEAAFGISSIETALPLLLELVREGRIPLPVLIERLTAGPARIFGLDAGTLALGARADLCVFDAERRWRVTDSSLRSRGKNTPLHGAELRGRVLYTVVRGRIVHAEDG